MPVSHIRMFVHWQKHTIAIHILYMDIPTGPLWYAHSYKTHIGMPLVIPYHNWLLIHTYMVCTYIHMYVAIGSRMSCTLHIWKIIPVQLNAQQPVCTLMALHGAHGYIQRWFGLCFIITLSPNQWGRVLYAIPRYNPTGAVLCWPHHQLHLRQHCRLNMVL